MLQEYPELAGRVQAHPSKDAAYVISTPPRATHSAYNYAYQQHPARPQMRTLFALWRAGMLPRLRQQLSAAKVSGASTATPDQLGSWRDDPVCHLRSLTVMVAAVCALLPMGRPHESG